MKITEANIDIVRTNGKLSSVSITMPIWGKVGNDDFLAVNIPLFGIKTFARDESDSEAAINEVLEAFCVNAERFGKGLENELKLIGWDFVEQKNGFTSMSFRVSNSNSVLDQIMQTGDRISQKLELAAC